MSSKRQKPPPAAGHCRLQDIPTIVVAVKHAKMTASRMEAKLRQATVPVIVRVDQDEILLDLRTVAEDEFGFILDGLKSTNVS